MLMLGNQIKKNRNKFTILYLSFYLLHFVLLTNYLDKTIPYHYFSDGRETEIWMMEEIKFHKTNDKQIWTTKKKSILKSRTILGSIIVWYGGNEHDKTLTKISKEDCIYTWILTSIPEEHIKQIKINNLVHQFFWFFLTSLLVFRRTL